ncbi:MAG TPA: GNAT family N-acetyltransferase [Acidimicrobiales bacterium]
MAPPAQVPPAQVPPVRVSRFADLEPATMYRILRLRSEVFIVEQECAYRDLDGRDVEATAWHLWIDGAGPTVAATARLLTDPDGTRVLGRIVTAAGERGRGRAGALIDRALALVAPSEVVDLNAQSRLEPWYGRWGFTRVGPDFVEDGIAHVPMRRVTP